MIKCLKVTCFFCILVLIGCSDGNKPPVIKFSKDSSSVVIKNIDKVNLLQLKNLINANTGFGDFLKVATVPEKGIGEIESENLHGTVTVLGDSLVFTPSKKFELGKSYLVESYIGAKFGTMGQFLKGKGQTAVHAQRKILTR